MTDTKICIAIVGPANSGKTCIRRALMVQLRDRMELSYLNQHDKFDQGLLPSTVGVDFVVKELAIDGMTYPVEIVWRCAGEVVLLLLVDALHACLFA